MPSKENIVVVKDPVSAASTGFVYAAAADVAVEELVAAIKQNLRLKSRSCHAYCAKSKRMSPYDVPQRTSNCGKDPFKCCAQCRSNHMTASGKTKENTDDPYELLQELLREGTLIKEAVKRLQIRITTPKQQTDYYECSDCEVPSNGSESRTLDL